MGEDNSQVIYTVTISGGPSGSPEVFHNVGNHKFVAANPHVLVLLDRDGHHLAYRILTPTDKVDFQVQEIIPASKLLKPNLVEGNFTKH